MVKTERRGKSKKTWEQTIKDDTKKRNLKFDGAQDKIKWRGRADWSTLVMRDVGQVLKG